MSDDWYKRYTRDAIQGMATLTLEERGAYNSIIDYIYLLGGSLPDEPRYIAGILNCDLRVWKRVRQQLIDKGRIELTSDGRIADVRASYELAKRDVTRSKRVASAQLGGIASGVSRQNKDLGEAHASTKTNQIREDKIREDKIREDKKDPPTPQGGQDAEFEIFWGLYPRKKGKDAARRAFRAAIKKASAIEILNGVKRYALQRKGDDPQYTKHPSSWLNGGHWADVPDPPKRNNRNSDEFVGLGGMPLRELT